MRGVVVLIGMILVLSGCTTVELAAHYAKKMNLSTEGDQQSSESRAPAALQGRQSL